MTSCASLTKFRDRQSESDLCMEEALKECEALAKPGATAFDTAVNWALQYKLCQTQHEILAHCVKEH